MFERAYCELIAKTLQVAEVPFQAAENCRFRACHRRLPKKITAAGVGSRICQTQF